MQPRRIAFALVIAGLLWAGARQLGASAQGERDTWPKTAGTVLVPPPEIARFVSLGYRELLADITWARTLVYFGSNWAGEGDLSQLEQLLDLIIELDPRFKAVYDWAPYAVVFKTGTATQAEYRSSLRYLDLAMKEFPDDYQYFWIAGSRYYWDLDAPDDETRRQYRDRGAALIEEAMQKPNAPPDLATTAANMRSRLGQHQRAVENLRRMVMITDNPDARDKMLQRLAVDDPGLAAELELAASDLEESWQRHMPLVPLDFYVLLGPPPPRAISFRDLATPHSLFGADETASSALSSPDPDDRDPARAVGGDRGGDEVPTRERESADPDPDPETDSEPDSAAGD